MSEEPWRPWHERPLTLADAIAEARVTQPILRGEWTVMRIVVRDRLLEALAALMTCR